MWPVYRPGHPDAQSSRGESEGGEGGHTVDLHLAVCNHRLDDALLLEVGKALSGQRTVDLHSVDEGGDSDQTVRLNILVELLGGGLVEDDGVLGLVLDLALGPLKMGKYLIFGDDGRYASNIPLLLLLLCGGGLKSRVSQTIIVF
ncbi:unnamed protein product [Fusarium venenatum]|uniref:Uncharacterized protein n=1 Tax=Fusarium venenatum TaxID=56646 RepID=A0A2L2TUW9_9HYPO|nr:uncharacterized protein FVRRES_09604 [Fusarium venenatum]CEI69527.1 unnamed protein product [Fusarium venenatum]